MNYRVRINLSNEKSQVSFIFLKCDESCHRINGPAIKWDNGNEWWYRNGCLHRYRLNGPVIHVWQTS